MKPENSQNFNNIGPLHLNLKKRRNKQLQSEEQKNDNSEHLKQLLQKLKDQYKHFETVTDNLFTTPYINTKNIPQNEYETMNEIVNQNNENLNSKFKSNPSHNLVNSNINHNYDPYKQNEEFLIQKNNNEEKKDDIINTDKIKINNNILPPSNKYNTNIKNSQNEKIKNSKFENNNLDEFDNIKFNEIITNNNNIPSNNYNNEKKSILNTNINNNELQESFEKNENNLQRKNNKIDELLDNELNFDENNLQKKSNKEFNNNLIMNSKFEYNNEFNDKNKIGNTKLKGNNNKLFFQNNNNFILNNNSLTKNNNDYEFSPEKKRKRTIDNDLDEDNQFNIGEKENEKDEFDEFESERKNNQQSETNLDDGIIKVIENEEIQNEQRKKLELEIELELNQKEREKKEEEERKKKELEDNLKREEEERKKKELEDNLKREEEEKKKKELEDKLKREEEERKKKELENKLKREEEERKKKEEEDKLKRKEEERKKKEEEERRKKIEERQKEIDNQFIIDDIGNEEINVNLKNSRILPPSNKEINSEDKKDNINLNSRALPPKNDIESLNKESLNKINESKDNKSENNEDKKSEVKKESNENQNNIQNDSDLNVITHEDDIENDLDSNLRKKIEKNKEKQKSFIKNINPQIIEKIETIVDKIYSFDNKEPNLNGTENFVHIDSLDVNEKKFSDNFNNYEELMKEESKNIKNKRKENFITKKNYKEKMDVIDSLDKYLSEISPSHIETMEKNEMEMNLNELLPEFETDFKEVILNENELLNEFNCPIGNLEKIDSFFYKYYAFDNYKLMEKTIKKFHYWRSSFPDGNSFYRIIMYGMFECYIISRNLSELKKLICDIIQEDYITFYRDRNIDVEVVLKILKLILTLVEKNEIEEAYNVLNKAFRLKNHFFDYTMIFYLRHVSFIYTKKAYSKIEKNYNENDKIINKNDLYNLNTIEEFGIEAEFFLVSLLPYLYNINIKIICIDNEIKNPIIEIISFEDDEEEEKNIFLCIGYFYCNYFNLYSNINNNLKKIIQKNHFKLKKIFVESKDKEICNICNNETVHLIFLQKKFIICKNCLDSHINKILKNRIKDFVNEEYNGLEYYNRPIHLQDDYYIDNYDIIQLYHENMKTKLYENQSLSCVSCAKLIDNNKYELKCGCKYCKNCFINLLKKVTQKYMCLNRYEIETFEKQKCSCGEIIDIEEMLKLYLPNENEKLNAEKRMKLSIKTHCYRCGKEIGKINQNNKLDKLEEHKKIKIKKEKIKNPLEFNDCEHFCCIPCYKQEKKSKINYMEDEEEENKDNKKNKVKKINCKICFREHIQIIDEEEDDGKCCNIY